MLLMSEVVSTGGAEPGLLLLGNVLDEAIFVLWESEVQQPRKKKSPQGVAELMIYTETHQEVQKKDHFTAVADGKF